MTESEAYIKNTKEQYESLGRFVEAFELMVDEVKTTCIKLMGPNPFDDRLPTITFHHAALTAKPLFDIMRAMIAQLIKQDDLIDTEERPVFNGVLAQLAKEYERLVSMRNNLLHGTWFVGYRSSDDPDSAEFHIKKQTVSQGGLGLLELPKTMKEMEDLKIRCEKVRDFTSALQDCIPLVGDGSSIARRFKLEEKVWVLKPYWKLEPSKQMRIAKRN